MCRLPVQNYRKSITSAAAQHSRLVIRAPTGTGKSTLVPRFLLQHKRKNAGNIYVLEPRRIAAVGLAWRVSDQLGESIGSTVGYQVRRDSCISPTTKIFFQTYGWFLQQLQQNPGFLQEGIVILDEFHERKLEMDAALAWLRLCQKKTDLAIKLIIMSATLDIHLMKATLPNAFCLEIPSVSFPVEMEYRPPLQRELPWQQAAQAFRRLLGKGITGTVLIFMPGRFEIDKTAEELVSLCRKLGWQLRVLHAGLSLKTQRQVLGTEGESENRVVISTNVAESAVTIPGVRAVIDSGMARVAGYDPEREVNTLYLRSIAVSNAAQRAGRAGRTGPGICIRLWSPQKESAMHLEPEPEVHRLDLTEIQLKTQCFLNVAAPDGGRETLAQIKWLSPPDSVRWRKAADNLMALGALDAAGRLSAFGERLARFPVHPKWGAIVLRCRDAGIGDLGAAMAAVASTGFEPIHASGDLAKAGASLLADNSGWPHDVWDTFRRLAAGEIRMSLSVHTDRKKTEKLLAQIWAGVFPEKMAFRNEGSRYRLGDGRVVTLRGQKASDGWPDMVVAVNLAETGGAGRSKRLSCGLWVPGRLDWMREAFPKSFQQKRRLYWDAKKARVWAVEDISFNGAPLNSREIQVTKPSAEAESILVENLLKGEISLPQWDKKFDQLWFRFRLLSRAYGDYGFPKLDREDRELFLLAVCDKQTSLSGLRKVALGPVLREYMGNVASAMLDKVVPERVKLPSGRSGRYTYYPTAMPELSARIGDFIGMEGEHKICEGRIKVLYNILAPNFRTVQRTEDIGRFWHKTYPEVKKELKRRYPKHPWP